MTQPRNNAGLFLCDDRGGTINVTKTDAKSHVPRGASLARRAAQLGNSGEFGQKTEAILR